MRLLSMKYQEHKEESVYMLGLLHVSGDKVCIEKTLEILTNE